MTFRVVGLPVAQGSMKTLPYRGQRSSRRSVVVHHTGPRLAVWRRTVYLTAAQAGVTVTAGPVALELRFYLPGGQPGVVPTGPPDLDKLERAVLDALKGLAWRDDSQVSAVTKRKRTARPGEPPGVRVTIRPDEEEA